MNFESKSGHGSTGNVPGMLCLFSAPLLGPGGKPLERPDILREENEIRKSTSNPARAYLHFGFASMKSLIKGAADGFGIIHLSAHSDETYLLLEDENGGSQLFEKKRVNEVIARAKKLELVMITSCHPEETARLLLEAGIKYVVAVRKEFPVYDFTATAFVAKFYSCLFNGRSVREAFEIARLEVESDPMWDRVRDLARAKREKEGKTPIPVERKFLLLPDNSPMDNEGKIAVSDGISRPAGEVFREMGIHASNLPVHPPEFFTGRSKEMYDIVNRLFEYRLITITGTGGIGKSTLSTEIGRWFHLRNFFKDGIYKIDLRGIALTYHAMRKLASEIGFTYTGDADFFGKLRNNESLIILENIDSALENDTNEFKLMIEGVLKTSRGIKLLATSENRIGAGFCEEEITCELKGLDRETAVKLFKKQIRTTPKPVDETNLSRLIDRYDGHPLAIRLMAGQMQKGITLDWLCAQVETRNARTAGKGSLDGELLDKRLTEALVTAYGNLSEKAKIVFLLLSYFPTGIEKSGLDQITGEGCADIAVELRDAYLISISNNSRLLLLPPVRTFAASMLDDSFIEEHGNALMTFTVEFSQFVRINFFSAEQDIPLNTTFILEEPNWKFVLENLRPTAENNALRNRETENKPKKKRLNKKDKLSQSKMIADNLLHLYQYNEWIKEGIRFGTQMMNYFRRMNSDTGKGLTLKSLGKLILQQQPTNRW